MPPRGGLRLSVIASTGALALAGASAASANDVVLWACHGPAGQALGSRPFQGLGAGTFDAIAGELGAGCGAPGTGFDAGGLQARLTRADPNGGSKATLRLYVPPNLALEGVSILRRTTGFTSGEEAGAAGGTQRYAVRTTSNGADLESASLGASGPLSGELTATTGGDRVQIGVSCDRDPNDPCSGDPIGVDVQHVAMTVADTLAPYGAAGYSDDASGAEWSIDLLAGDTGVGLARAEVLLDATVVATAVFGDDTCKDLSAGDATIDLPLGASCPPADEKTLKIDSTAFADGDHRLDIRLYDGAGNTFPLVAGHTVHIDNHPNYGSNTATLSIGSGNASTPRSSDGNGGRGGVAGASRTSCSSPKLSMLLSQKPLRLSHGVPVLEYGKRYRFRGRLTCVVRGKRRSASRRTRIDLLNTIGGRTFEKGGATVRDQGRITIIVAYKSSRTLIFRYTNADGRRSQVKIEIKVSRTS